MSTAPAPFAPAPVVLEGPTLRLEPLRVAHAAMLFETRDESCFVYSTQRPPTWDLAGFEAYVGQVVGQAGRIPFAVIERGTGRAIGTSSYYGVRAEHRSLEIGYTWLVSQTRGTRVNPEKKWLMLRHAFEALGAIRVQLVCDARNARSAAAMLKLGCRYEGTLRKHIILPDGFQRDTKVFSIVEEEWAGVKAGLEGRMGEGK